MNTTPTLSDAGKSNSNTSESERQIFRKKLSSFVYPTMPKTNKSLREESLEKLRIGTNLYELKFIDQYHKLTLFKIEILPLIDNDNFILRRQIYNYIELALPKSFKKSFFGGNILLTFINEDKSEKNNIELIELKEEINNMQYNIKLTKIKEIELKKVNDFQGYNQRIKTVIEILFRSILMRNPNVIKFKDRTIFEIDPKNITNITEKGKENIYRGYITSVNITESGLYMLINNVNKVITGKTVYSKMIEIRNKLKEDNCSMKEIEYKINEYFSRHRTVLTTYGSLKPYRIEEITFDKTPNNTVISIIDINGKKSSVSIINYYRTQYGITIKDINQPLIIAQKNFKNKNLLSENDYIIYLVPELVYITGNEDDEENQNNRRNKFRNIISKTKMDPNKKMSAINTIFNLYNSDKHKKIKKKTGQVVEMKSPQELIDEWGINLGNNLIFDGRLLPQPKLHFKNNVNINPNNGLFRANNPINNKETKEITNNNIFYIYDQNEENKKRINHKDLFAALLKKCKEKEFKLGEGFNPYKVLGYGIQNTNTWDNIYNSLRRIDLSERGKKIIGIIFCSDNLGKYYTNLKNYFLKQCNIPTQHIFTKNIDESQRGRAAHSIQFNIIDQINIKIGGMNYYIDFKESNIIKKNEIFLIIGLDAKTAKKRITYSMVSTKHPKLNMFITQEETCNYTVKEEKNNTLKKMFKNAIEELQKAKCPHSPDYIILYRQGGNEIHNKRLTINELDNFIEVLNDLRERNKDNQNYNYKNTKFYYICCNLKSNLKFFEINEEKKAYKNPKSGLVVDDYVTQKDKYEFYIQPQFVNQGTATPCHYEVMYYDKDICEENNLQKENLEKLSFYLSYYYWTWAGSIRTPSMLKMSTTALDFYYKCLYEENSYFFDVPYYI